MDAPSKKRIGYWKGKKLSPESKEKMRLAKIGKKASEETKKKMSLAHKGHKRGGWTFNEETREKFRDVQYKIIASGKRNYSYKGGVTSVKEKIRKSLKYRIWRESVFKRDDYTCIWCNKKGGKLNADHIIPFYKIVEKIQFQHGVENLFENSLKDVLLWDLSNGRTLCIQCHKNTDTYGFKTINKIK